MPNPEAAIKTGTALRWLWLTVLIVILDQVSKFCVINSLEIGERIPLLPVFNLTHVHNPGAAFSLFADFGGGQRWGLALVALLVSILLLWWMKKTSAKDKILGISYGLILGGALGNLYDRIVYGYVEDFISVFYQSYYFPAFNIADSAITIGALLLIYDAITSKNSNEVSSNAQ